MVGSVMIGRPLLAWAAADFHDLAAGLKANLLYQYAR